MVKKTMPLYPTLIRQLLNKSPRTSKTQKNGLTSVGADPHWTKKAVKLIEGGGGGV